MATLPVLRMHPVPVRVALLIGQDAEIDRNLHSVLEPKLWAIQHAIDNASALLMAHVKHFDVILTSQQTSGKKDLELLRKLRTIRPHTRLIILASEGTPADVIEAMRQHAFSYLSRPFSPDALRAIVRQAMEDPCWDDGIEVIAATPEWIRLLVRCDLKTADRVIQFMDEIAELPDPDKSSVAAAFREMLINAIEHGGRLDPMQQVEISYLRTRRLVACQISDPGDGFTLDEIPHAAIANPEDNPLRHLEYREACGMRPGGFGVLLTQRLVDELVYNEKGNEVVLIKYLDDGTHPRNETHLFPSASQLA